MRQSSHSPTSLDFDATYKDATARWEIGRPQRAFSSIAQSGLIAGNVLDVGCGTGEHALMAAAMGMNATGIDTAPTAIAVARAKARERKLKAAFLIHDVLGLTAMQEQFDTVIDSGLFHVLGDTARPPFCAGLRSVLRPGGRYLMLCFRAEEHGQSGQRGIVENPRRVSEEEIRAIFADGWQINSIEPTKMEIRTRPEGVAAWLAVITRC